MTVALPDSSDKTLLDAEDGKLTVSWTYDNLDFYPYDSMREIKANWRIEIVPQLNGRPFGHSTWTRAMGGRPARSFCRRRKTRPASPIRKRSPSSAPAPPD